MNIVDIIIIVVLILCTFLTSYHFVSIGLIFNYYVPMQIGLIVTFLCLAFKFIITEKGRKKVLYFSICLIIILTLVILMKYVK